MNQEGLEFGAGTEVEFRSLLDPDVWISGRVRDTTPKGKLIRRSDGRSDFVLNHRIRLPQPRCGKGLHENQGRRCFGEWNKCAECYVYGHVDPLLNVLDWREPGLLPLPDKYLRLRKTIRKTRAFILASGGISKRRDKRLQATLLKAIVAADEILPIHPDEEEWLPE